MRDAVCWLGVPMCCYLAGSIHYCCLWLWWLQLRSTVQTRFIEMYSQFHWFDSNQLTSWVDACNSKSVGHRHNMDNVQHNDKPVRVLTACSYFLLMPILNGDNHILTDFWWIRLWNWWRSIASERKLRFAAHQISWVVVIVYNMGASFMNFFLATRQLYFSCIVEYYILIFWQNKVMMMGEWVIDWVCVNMLGECLIEYTIFLHGIAEQLRSPQKRNLA